MLIVAALVSLLIGEYTTFVLLVLLTLFNAVAGLPPGRQSGCQRGSA